MMAILFMWQTETNTFTNATIITPFFYHLFPIPLIIVVAYIYNYGKYLIAILISVWKASPKCMVISDVCEIIAWS